MNNIFFNGRIVPENCAMLSVLDRGFLYGDGFFETILAVDGKPEYLGDHLERLLQSCREFRIQCSLDSVDWYETIDAVLEANNLRTGLAVVKIIVTRGVAKPGLNLTDDTTPTVIVMTRPYSHPSPSRLAGGGSLQ